MRYLFIIPFFLSVATAHENQLSGLVYTQPQAPLNEEPFLLTLELIGPDGAYVPSALLNLSLEETDISIELAETQNQGIYQTRLSLPEGLWIAELNESTFEGEENKTRFGLWVGSENLEFIEILFPPPEEKPTRAPQTHSQIAFALLTFFGLIVLCRIIL